MPWYKYSGQGEEARPLVAVRLWHGNRSVPLIALIDSGADASLLNADYAYLLGLVREDAEVDEDSVGADGNPFETLTWPNVPLELQFGNDRFAFEGSFAEFPDGADGQNLLGRKDFFNRYIVQFWDSKSLMNIDLSPDFAEDPLL